VTGVRHRQLLVPIGPVTAKLCVLATGRKRLVSALWAGRLQIQARVEPTFDISPARAAPRPSGKACISESQITDSRQNVRFVKSRARRPHLPQAEIEAKPPMAKTHSFAVTGPDSCARRVVITVSQFMTEFYTTHWQAGLQLGAEDQRERSGPRDAGAGWLPERQSRGLPASRRRCRRDW
jgi:hypothetical protein